MAAAILPELGKTCAQKKKIKEQTEEWRNNSPANGWQGGAGCVPADGKRSNIRCLPSPCPLAGTGSDWTQRGLEWGARELTRGVICIFMEIRMPKLQAAHLRLQDAGGKDSERAPNQSPRGEGG